MRLWIEAMHDDPHYHAACVLDRDGYNLQVVCKPWQRAARGVALMCIESREIALSSAISRYLPPPCPSAAFSASVNARCP